MSTLLIFLILFFGTFLIMLEIFLLPGFVIGLMGFALCVWASIEAYSSLGPTTGSIVIGVTVVLNIVLAYIGLKNLHKSPAAMKASIDGRVNEFSDFGLKPGDRGFSITALRPEGKANFGENYISVWAFTGFIDTEKEIEIVRIADNKIFVTQLNH